MPDSLEVIELWQYKNTEDLHIGSQKNWIPMINVT